METNSPEQPVPSAGNGEASHHPEPDPRVEGAEEPFDATIKPTGETPNGTAEDVAQAPQTDQVSTEQHRLTASSVIDKPADRPKDSDSRRGEDKREDKAEKSDKRDKDKDRDKHRSSSKDMKKESRRSRSRSRDRSKKRSRTRSRSKDQKKRHSRSRSRDRRRSRRSGTRSRSPSRGRKKHSESPGKGRTRRSSSADYGGYVPRKRQDGPSRSEHKREYRDRERERDPVPTLPPGGYSSANDPFYYLRNQNSVPTDPQEALRAWQEQQLRARQLVLQQQAASAAAAASKTQREVYVGNLVAGLVTDAALRQVFNSALSAAFPGSQIPGMEPVVNVSMHSDGRYAFVELRTPEMATAALQLSAQVQLLGQPITVGRPSGYVDPIKAQQQAQQAAAALAAFQAGDTSVAAAVLGTAAPPGIPALMSSSPAAPVAVSSPGILAGASSLPTEFLCVTGMVTPDVLVDEQEYRDVQDDLREECSKYGLVVEVKVPRPPVPSQAPMLFNTGNFGKAFVRFADPSSSSRARDAVHGRMFAGNVVNATFITGQAYASI